MREWINASRPIIRRDSQAAKTISVTNVHLDLGAGRRGTDMGPSAMHVAGLVPELRRLGHHVEDIVTIGSKSFEALEPGDPTARFLSVIEQTVTRLADRVAEACGAGHFPLVLGGDHAQAVGTVSGLARHYHGQNKKIGLVWVDAHTDMNTPETTPSGNVHGMPLACLLGRGPQNLLKLSGRTPALEAHNVVIVGAREVDPGEVALIEATGVRVYTMTELDRRGTSICLEEAFERAMDGTCGVHLSFDLDVVDPQHAPGVGTPVPGGLSLRESHLVCEMAAALRCLIGLEVVELNPTLDLANQTGRLAVWLILSALGKSII